MRGIKYICGISIYLQKISLEMLGLIYMNIYVVMPS